MTWVIRTVVTISLAALPIYLYVGLRLASSITRLRPNWRRAARRGVAALIGWFCIFPLLVIVDSSLGMTSNRFDLVTAGRLVHVLLVYPYWVMLIAVVELAGPFLVIDLASLAGRLRPFRFEQWRRILAIVRISLAIAGVVFVSVKAFIDTNDVRDSVITTKIHNLPQQLDGFRITIVGDLQVDKYTGEEKVKQMHQIVESRAPGLLLFAGDIVTGGVDYVGKATAAMCDVKGSLASIAVMGDHDYWSAPDAIVNGLRGCGWDFLNNQHRVLEYHGKRILVTGLTHIYSQRLDESELDTILSRAPVADLKILLVHQPAQWLVVSAAKHGYDLLLAGHTHGGQIVLHPFGIPVTPSMRETQYYSGAYTLGSMNVVVTNGIGLTLAPIRYCAPAEVTTVVLRPE